MRAALAARSAALSPVARTPLHVVGNTLRDQSGQRFVIVAAECRMVPFYDNGSGGQDSYLSTVTTRNYGQRATEFAKLRALGFNTVRVQTYRPAVYSAALYETKAAAITRHVNILASAKAAGLMVIFCPDSEGSDLTSYTGYEPFFADLYASVGNDPSMIIELLNEPADYTSYPAAPLYRAAMKGLGAYVRGLGYTQPMIVPLNNYQQGIDYASTAADLTAIAADAVTNSWVGRGLLYGYHAYNDQFTSGNDTWNSSLQAFMYGVIGQLINSWPMINTESGRFNNSVTATVATQAMMRYMAGLTAQGLNGIELFGFDWASTTPGGGDVSMTSPTGNTGSDPSSMSYDGVNPNAWGLAFIAASLPYIDTREGAITAPKNTVAPAITGTAQVGLVLTCSAGTWSGGTQTYQWMKDGVDISAATASTYTVVSGDAGHLISCRVTSTLTGAGAATAAVAAAVTPVAAPTTLNEPFTGTTGATVQSLGHMTKRATSVSDMLIESNRARAGTGFGQYAYYGSAPATADYTVTCDVYFVQAGGTGTDYFGPAARMDTTADTQYFVQWATGGTNQWYLLKRVAGTETFLASYNPGTAPTAASTVSVAVKCTGTSIQMYVGGTLRSTVTDSSITAIGRPGMYASYSDAGSSSTLRHIDNLVQS